MKTSSNGRKFIEGFEGLILQAYDDHNDKIVEPGQVPIGVLTIGYGHTTAAGPPAVHVGDKITEGYADQYLSNDLAKVEDQVNLLVKVPLNQNQFDALVSFQYNTGALARSSALPLLNAKQYEQAADHLTLYNEEGGHVVQGLVRRRNAEKSLFMSPVAPTPVNKTAGPTIAVTTVAVGTTATVAASHAPSEFWHIVLGLMVAGIVIGLIVHWYENRKVATNVA